MSKNNDAEILKLLSFVRQHQTYKGDVLKKPQEISPSVLEWLEVENVHTGPYRCTGAELCKLYKNWCTQTNKEPVPNRTFHIATRQVLKYVESKNKHNLWYYINKKVNHDPKKTKQKAGQEAKKE